MKYVAIIHRKLREGKTYKDYRKAWFHTKGFGVPTKMYSIINAFDPREIISIGIIESESEKIPDLLKIDINERLKSSLDDIIEQTIIRYFGIVVAEDDFSSSEELKYLPFQIDGIKTDFKEIEQNLYFFSSMLNHASKERDNLKKKKK